MNNDKNTSAPRDKGYPTKDQGEKSRSDVGGELHYDNDVPKPRGMTNNGVANGDNKFHEREKEKVDIRRKHKEEVQNQGNQVQGVH